MDTRPDDLQPGVIELVTHPDPYPHYAAWRNGPPLRFDPRLQAWVASSAGAVAAVLADPQCRVRPIGQPVPPALVDTPAGELFARLIRMNEGDRHATPRQVLQRVLGRIDPAEARARARQLAGTPPHDPRAVSDWLFDLPIACVADRLGVAEADLREVAARVREFVACLSPLSDATRLRIASAAAARLHERVDALLDAAPACPGSLLATLQRGARTAGWDDRRALVANLVGLLSQTCDATAGWLGGCLVALQREPVPREDALEDVALEVARHDPATQNTRRFVAAPTRILGIDLAAGDAIIVVLAAASRDPALNASPDAFLVDRADRRLPTFGAGRHACPGQALATAVVTGALQAWCAANAGVVLDWRYRPLVNIRIPMFVERPGAQSRSTGRVSSNGRSE